MSLQLLQIKVFEDTCENVEFFIEGREGEKDSWDRQPQKGNRSWKPFINSARKFTDHCTIIKMREDIKCEIDGRLKKELPIYKEEPATNFFKDLSSGK